MTVERETFAQVAPWLAAIGNALLASPSSLNERATALFDAGLWEELATCGDADVAAAAQKLVAYLGGSEGAADASRETHAGVRTLDAGGEGSSDFADRARCASVEFAHLFVGPPKPAVAPWETFYRQQGCAVGFGEATHLMRAALHDSGLELAQAGRQYEDHMGIELLLASELCRRAGQAVGSESLDAADWDTCAGCGCPSPAEHAADFVRTRPLSWMPALRNAVERECPNGFYAALLQLAQALLELVA